MSDEPYTEGVCGDGAVVLRDGVPVPIAEVLRMLNNYHAFQMSVLSYLDDESED